LLHKSATTTDNYRQFKTSRAVKYWGADKSLARPGRKQATATKL